LKNIKSYNKKAPIEVWRKMWKALSLWQKNGRNYSDKNELAWKICLLLDDYDSNAHGIVKSEFWEHLWDAFDNWTDGIDRGAIRKQNLAIQIAEQKRMDREFQEKIK
jgi:hypothetical protein